MGENVNVPEYKISGWKRFFNIAGWTVGGIGLIGAVAFFVSMNVSRENAQSDANGRKFTVFEEVVMPGSVAAQINAKKQDSMFQVRKDSLELVQQAKIDSAEQAQKAAKEAKANKGKRRTSQLNIDAQQRTGLALNSMQQAVLRVRHFQRVQGQKLKC